MIPVTTLGLAPTSDTTAAAQVEALLHELLRQVDGCGPGVLSLTAFVAEAAHGAAVHAVVDELFAAEPPPVTVVVEPPERGHVALEATVLPTRSAEVEVVRRTCGGARYTVLAHGAVRQLHVGGLTHASSTRSPAAQAAEAFAALQAVLGAESMSFGNVVRQWNYIERMLDHHPDARGDRQRYQAFNDARTVAFEASAFPDGYPASTGIGQTAGGIVLEAIAVTGPGEEVEVTALSNPEQVEAHRYSGDVLVGHPALGLDAASAPKFARAKRVTCGDVETVFVSGTAAILGERSVAEGDVLAQTRTTLAHIDGLLEGRAPSYLRGYVKRASDIPAVREICTGTYGPIGATYVQADICREELLVELEAVRTDVR